MEKTLNLRHIGASPRLSELSAVPRVELPADVPDDAHNRIDGLVDLICDCFGPTSQIVEVGTGMGVSTEVFALLIGKVITIDPHLPGSKKWEQVANVVINKYPDRITYFKRKDEDVYKEIPDRSLDGVYIDGNHDYESVYPSILRWTPKVKAGGWVCGHDYIERPQYNFGVIRAVKEAFGGPRRIYQDTSWAVKL